MEVMSTLNLKILPHQTSPPTQTRLDSSDSTAGKLAWTRLEERINDLERDLEAERSKVNEKEKEQRKQERRVQEMDLHLVEQQDLQLKLGELCEKMQLKIRAYKKHLDEAVCSALMLKVVLVEY